MSTNTPAKSTPSRSAKSRSTKRDGTKTNGRSGKTAPKNVKAARSAPQVFGDAAIDGQVYRWGIAASTQTLVGAQLETFSRLACEQKLRKPDRSVDLESTVQTISRSTPQSPAEMAFVVAMAAAIDGLDESMDPSLLEQTVENFVGLHRDALTSSHASPWAHLLLGIELGLTLAWRRPDHPDSKTLARDSIGALTDWCDGADESLSSVIEKSIHSRLALASLMRISDLVTNTAQKKLPKSFALIAEELATWVAAMTQAGGTTAFSRATAAELHDDGAENGLLDRAAECDPAALKPAIAAAMGRSQTGGRLAWEISLPESFHVDDDAKLAVLLPEWDVRRGRMHVDFRDDEISLEMFAGRSKVINGTIRTEITTDGVTQQSCGTWEEICQYSDDDIHYLELEQAWSGDLVLQRQLMLVRDDRCVLFADAVIDKSENAHSPPSIQYACQLPIDNSIVTQTDGETNEVFLCRAGKKPSKRALAMPLAANEWLIGPSDTKFDVVPSVTDDCQYLQVRSKGTGKVYSPLWFDFERSRFKRKRTWRKLTVADQLRLCDDHEACAYRVQAGSEHWVIYRDMEQPKCRTFLGKHMMANFFASRFDMTDGYHESLVTVDDDDES